MPLLQGYRDILKLFNKDRVISDKVSWIFKITPYVVFSTATAAALFVPVSTGLVLPSAFGDIFIFVYILALGRFFLVLSGMDTGSTFGGMGSSREILVTLLFEPALLVALLSVGRVSASTSMQEIVLNTAQVGDSAMQPVFILSFAAIFLVLIAEASRVPVDDPSTHLELTMVHEAMILEYSGKHLALLEWGASIKQLIFITILVNLFIPLGLGMGLFLSIVLYVVKVLILCIFIGIFEVGTVKIKLFSLPNLAALSFIAAFVGFLQQLLIRGGMSAL
jgi:formate hydrogenlyase subunit 4